MDNGLVAWIIIGVIAGFLTGEADEGLGYGVFMDIIVGLLGAFIGGFISRQMGMGDAVIIISLGAL